MNLKRGSRRCQGLPGSDRRPRAMSVVASEGRLPAAHLSAQPAEVRPEPLRAAGLGDSFTYPRELARPARCHRAGVPPRDPLVQTRGSARRARGSPPGPARAAASNSRRLSSSIVWLTSYHRRASTGTATMGCLRRIIGCGEWPGWARSFPSSAQHDEAPRRPDSERLCANATKWPLRRRKPCGPGTTFDARKPRPQLTSRPSTGNSLPKCH